MTAKNVTSSDSDYRFAGTQAEHTHNYLATPILALCRQLKAKQVLDLGCGNGALCQTLAEAGFSVTGCDPSESGIAQAQSQNKQINYHLLGVYDDPQALASEGKFDAVVSTEVVEHLFSPRHLPRFARAVLKPGGYLILSTPYHGYLKNVLLALANKWDFHHTPLWDGGHIKFWSRRTLTQMLEAEGFAVTQFVGAGRLPYLWKSMIILAKVQ